MLANQRAAQHAATHCMTQMQRSLSHEQSLTKTSAHLLWASHPCIPYQHYSHERPEYDGGVAGQNGRMLSVHLPL